MADDLGRTFVDFLEKSHFMEPDAMAEAANIAGDVMGARELVIHLADLEQKVLVPLLPSPPPDGEPVSIDGSLAGQAYTTGSVVDAPAGDGHQVWTPLVDGAERIGVIGFVVGDIDDPMRRRCLALAALITQFVITKDQYTDVYEVAARQRDMTLASELQRRLLPPLTCTTRRLAVAAVIEPAYDLGGDAFDYAVNGDRAHLAIVDAMGHGIDASLPAVLALASVRHSRRRRLDLEAVYLDASDAVRDRFDGDSYVTADLADLDIERGRLRWINAGHPPPLLVRRGQAFAELTCKPSPPLGLGTGVVEVAEVTLEPWDRVLFFTDGVTEGHVPEKEPFGTDRLGHELDRLTREGLGPAETMRRLAQAVLGHSLHRLDDDFTLLCVELRAASAEPAPASGRIREQTTI